MHSVGGFLLPLLARRILYDPVTGVQEDEQEKEQCGNPPSAPADADVLDRTAEYPGRRAIAAIAAAVNAGLIAIPCLVAAVSQIICAVVDTGLELRQGRRRQGRGQSRACRRSRCRPGRARIAHAAAVYAGLAVVLHPVVAGDARLAGTAAVHALLALILNFVIACGARRARSAAVHADLALVLQAVIA